MRILNFLALALLLTLPARAADDLAPLLARLPAKTLADESAVAADLAKLGPAAVKDLCAQLTPIGTEGKDDGPARAAIVALQRRAGAPGNDADRRALAAALADALAAVGEPEPRAFLIARLQNVGGDDSVGPIAAYLSDKALVAHAAAALERIGTPRAVAALEQALDAADDALRVPIIKSLGSLRAAGKVDAIRKSAASADAALRLTALWALANVGDAAARDLLETAQISASGEYEKAKIVSFRLLLIERRFPANADESAAAARDLVKKYAEAREGNVAIVALHLLAANLGDAALPDLLAAADNSRADLRNGALDAAALIKGEPATAKWTAKLAETKSPLTKVDVLAFLGRRADLSALDGVLAAAKDADPAARLEAARAAVRLAGDRAIDPLIAALKSAPADKSADPAKVVEILARLPGPKAVAALAAAVTPDAPAPVQVALLDALGARGGAAAGPAILAAAKSAAAPVRAAAWRAAERTAAPADTADLITLALAADESDQPAAFKAVAAAAAQAPAGQRAAPLLAALPKTTGPARAALLRALAKTAEPAALAAVVADLDSADAPTKDAAIRALAESPDDAAAAPLLDLAAGGHGATANQQVLALRGVVGVARASGAGSDQKVALYARAIKAAGRPDEKKLALAALSAERTPAALAVAAPLLDDPALKPEAALAVVKIAAPLEKGQKGLTGDLAAAALEKAIPICPDAAAKAAAVKHLATLKKK